MPAASATQVVLDIPAQWVLQVLLALLVVLALLDQRDTQAVLVIPDPLATQDQ